jgi:hypothetical protein
MAAISAPLPAAAPRSRYGACDQNTGRVEMHPIAPRVDADRRVDVDVWLACMMRSRFDESLAELHALGLPGERHICRLAVAYLCGQPPPERNRDPLGDAHLDRQALRLHTFIDGPTLQAAMYPREFPAEEVRRLLDEELAALLPNEPSR